MDDDAPRAAPKAGRRAGRTMNTWGEDSGAPPEPQKGGFGLDSGFGSSSPAAPAPRTGGFDLEETTSARLAPLSPSQQPDDDPSPVPARTRTSEISSERPSAQRGAPAPLPPSTGPASAAPSAGKAAAPDILGGDSKKFVGVSRRKQEQLARGDDEVSRKNLKYESLTAGVDGIMEIPELEDEGREDLSNVVAEAPKVRINKVQGMDELDEDMHYKLPAMDDRDIDLSLLTAVLCSSEQVQEPDELWDSDIVLTEVASAINAEREKAEGGDPELGADGAGTLGTPGGKDEIVVR